MNETAASTEDAPIATATRVPPEPFDDDESDDETVSAPAPTATRVP